MMVLILTFTNVFYIMNQERGKPFQYTDLSGNSHEYELYGADIEGRAGFLNSFIYMYKLTLGDFSTKYYLGMNAEVLWIIFFAATFLLQITFLNMLIAIMGDTFSHVMDNKEESSMKERVSILADFRLLLRSLGIDSEF